MFLKFCKRLTAAAALLLALCLLAGCAAEVAAPETSVVKSAEGTWTMGYGSEKILLPAGSAGPLYIAGFDNGVTISGVRDDPRASAVWMDTDGQGVLLISVDCIALASETMNAIREKLAGFCAETGCVSVNVTATHTHAGIDTLGLWGPEGVDGKNASYMENLILAAVQAAESAYADRCAGTLYYSTAATHMLEYDSRDPYVFDPHLYQLRFAPDDSAQNGIRLLTFGAHAEALRDDNTLLSRDYPGVLCDSVKAQSGDDALFLPGALGGQIVTRDLCTGLFDAEENLVRTGELLAQAVMEIEPAAETEVAPVLSAARVEFDAPLDNTLYMYYKLLGVLESELHDGESATGYTVRSELSALSLGDVTMLLLPGEIFPELVTGEGLEGVDPESLSSIAASFGREKLIVAGLSNDELGYIVPPSDFVLNDTLPYIETVDDASEDHYEETNSIGPDAAAVIAGAVRDALELLK